MDRHSDLDVFALGCAWIDVCDFLLELFLVCEENQALDVIGHNIRELVLLLTCPDAHDYPQRNKPLGACFLCG